MRHLRFLACHSHFNEDLQKQLATGSTHTFQTKRNSALITITRTPRTFCDQPVWEITAECSEADVGVLIQSVLPGMSSQCSSMSRSCSTIAGLIANGLEDGTYIFTGGEWTRYDQAESMLSDLDAVTEVFEVPLDDPRRTSSSSGTVGSSSIHSGITSSSSSTDPSSTNSSSSSDQQQSQSQQQSQQDTSIFRGVRARCGIPAKVLITAYDGINTTSLDKINHNGASDADYFQRYLVGPDQYFRNTSVFNYGNPLGRSKGPMINDRTGTGKGFNCGLGCLLRKKGKQAQLQDVVVTTKDVPAGEELLAAYKLDAAAAQEV